MLLTVEGGGFFSSSASGYSKGLTLLLLGQKHEDRPMRVSPWNHYQLVDQEPDPDLQLASIKNRLSRGCASFVCFGRTSAGLDTPSPLKVGPVQQQDVLPGPLDSDKSNDHTSHLEDGNSNARKVALKSSLKKPSNSTPVPLEDVNDHEASGEKDGDIPSHTERRKVQWTDACGSELAEIKEFEPSETGGSDDEFDSGSERTCSCTIM
ncbi:Low affinity potassium transport system protein kup isoform 1 [Theobroma cacao]|uniref:Low affinity potassium transport system protein kup isoform 1 n=1 Tax=Theobroma cacao TaxID=3641 RepID=A0A061FHK2_THECC|nr:Low affinity potassium transport system protein kup isoform 1 [Theobroma cacao]EOY16815.1 Low affinity potassium transport system protein kup isoform 1 [Theobroma cacao]